MAKDEGGKIGVVTALVRGAFLVNAVYAEDFYAETCRRIDLLPSGLDAPEREQLADLLGRVVRDNAVPVVFVDPA
ncbi:hypothetical protein OG361_01695 [Streptomyces sp. NBC_00090]|uniref:hypothetical protein n=1 Tax=Streptomyces sp. NBC_00090 TaxID=2903619 RepID=UPI0032530C63